MSTGLSDPVVLSAIFSAIAAAVSALTLWFTSLKGPDIELVNTPSPRIQVEDTPLHIRHAILIAFLESFEIYENEVCDPE